MLLGHTHIYIHTFKPEMSLFNLKPYILYYHQNVGPDFCMSISMHCLTPLMNQSVKKYCYQKLIQ